MGVGHGPIFDIKENREVRFSDRPMILNDSISVPSETSMAGTRIDMAILATGYREECVVEREDRPSGMYTCGLGGRSDRFLPLQSIGEEARRIAEDVAALYPKR